MELSTTPPSSSSGALTIPIPQEKLGDFLKGLLGRPQTIRKNYIESYIIKNEDLINLYHLVQQRVNQQHIANLIEFRITVWLDDASSIEMGSIEEFETYSDVKTNRTTRVLLYWSYLIQFPDKSLPERQDIEVDFGGREDRANKYIREYWLRNDGQVEYVIRHTARTWGNDIDALLSRAISGLLIKPEPWRQLVNKYSSAIAFVVVCLLLAAHICATYILMSSYSKVGLANIAQHTKGLSGASRADAILDYLASYLIQGGWSQIIFFSITALFIAIAGSIALGVYIDENAHFYRNSHVLLNKASREYFLLYEKRRNAKWHKYIWTTIGSIIIGLLCNYIYYLIGAPHTLQSNRKPSI